MNDFKQFNKSNNKIGDCMQKDENKIINVQNKRVLE